MSTTSAETTQVFEIYIRATPQAIWDAITKPEWTSRYGYGGRVEYDLRRGGSYKFRATPQMVSMGIPEVAIDGEVIEADPPHKLVHTYRWMFTEAMKAEGFSRIIWEIAETPAGFTRLTVIHEVEGQPSMAHAIKTQFNEQGGGGWNWILSDLKSLLETGKGMSGEAA